MVGTPGHTGARLRWFAAVVTVAALTSGCLVLPPAAGREDLPVGYLAPVTRMTRDIAYGPDPDQSIDLYLPSTPGPHPVLVYLHGGGWVGGSHEVIPEFLLRQVSRANMALASVDYRIVTRLPDNSVLHAFPAQVSDVDRAVRFLRAGASTWNLDPARILLSGASAGATLAMLAAVAPGRYPAADLPPELVGVSPSVLGVLDFVGPTDFATFPAAGGWAPAIAAAFLGCPTPDPATCDPATVAAASVVDQLGPGAPPVFMAYGRDDGLVLPSTQGWPAALRWTAARGELGLEPVFLRGVYYFRADAGHNIDGTVLNVRVMEIWLDAVLAGILR